MFSNSQRAIGAYTRVGVETGVASASPQQLILMLYEGALAAIAAAQQHLRSNDVAAKGKAVSQAIAIIDGGLKASLDMNVGGALAKNLSELYDYMGRRLVQANLKNDPAALEEVRQLLRELYAAWHELSAKSTAESNAAPQPRRAAPRSRTEQSEP